MARKSIFTVILLLLTLPSLFSQRDFKIVKDPVTGKEMLYGKIDTASLKKSPFSEWYDHGYASYQPDTDTQIKLINAMAPEFNYTIVMGTWCPDSRREVPRMMKVLDEAGVPASHITMYAIDRKLKARHTVVQNLNIERVPTLIVTLKGEELGRIVESPVNSVEKDLLGILSGD
jgi:thiol-disulfide isomerase/thioredoxin